MRRLATDFYADIKALRDRYGETEYSRNDLLPATVVLIKKYLKDDDELVRDAAIEILDRFDKRDEEAAGGLFPEDGHVKLGGTQRIKRSAMTLAHLLRRKAVIDNNRMAQDQAWATETNWVNPEIEAMQGYLPGTTRSQIGRGAGKTG